MNTIAAAILEEDSEGGKASTLGRHDDEPNDDEDEDFDLRSKKKAKKGQKVCLLEIQVNLPKMSEQLPHLVFLTILHEYNVYE